MSQGFYILHEGLIGVVDDSGLEEISYTNALENPPTTFKSEHGWLGITDKYWATVVDPRAGQDLRRQVRRHAKRRPRRASRPTI